MDHLIAPLPAPVALAEGAGNFKLANRLIDRLLAGPLQPGLKERLSFERERLERLRLAYPYDRRAAQKILRGRLKNFRNAELDAWIKAGYAAPRLIDGRERFMSSFASNIVFCDSRLKRRLKVQDTAGEESLGKAMARVDELLAGAPPARYRVRARVTLTLKKNPAGKVRCWLPFPRVGDQVSAARLLAASHEKYRLAPPGAEQRTIYFETRAKRFWAEFEYEISEWLPGGPKQGPVPAAAKRYLREEPPHIVFTPQVRALAKAIVGKEKDPYGKARRIYGWLTANLTYNFTLPYGVFENISERCLADLKGDCGFQALAFITLCRAAGVPAKWQSGWALRPGRAGYHDWAMFYAGRWRPADISFGTSRRRAGQEKRRWFYFGNLDGGRMVANSEMGAPLWPRKRHWRTDPTDNQSGEAETAAGNLYYDRMKTRLKLLSYERLG
ncbi:MAG: transglutaminase domain-containing protein [Elusimicrobiales bacterium]|nr:transglutaminase domain-containing protein [Elusimicrobiales bacterium]